MNGRPAVLDEAQVAALAAELREQLAAPDVLDVAAVQARYRRADPRAARTVMHEAGAFKVGGRLHSRLEDLRRLEADRPHSPRRLARNDRARHLPPAPRRLQEFARPQPGRRSACSLQIAAPGSRPRETRIVTIGDGATITEARQERRCLLAAARRVEPAAATVGTVHELAVAYLRAKARLLAPSTIVTTEDAYRVRVAPHLRDVTRQLGHASSKITAAVYEHLLDDALLDDALEAFDRSRIASRMAPAAELELDEGANPLE